MTTLAERAQANAQRARSAQDARGVTRTEAEEPKPQQALRSHQWAVWKADDTVVEVCVYPACTRAELRHSVYPDAKSLLMQDEL